MENGKNLIHSFNNSEHSQGNFNGLTKREYFAGLAMQGLLANPDLYVNMKIGQEAVLLADELLAELAKPTKTD